MESEWDQILKLERFATHRVCVVLGNERHNVCHIEDGAVLRAHGVFKVGEGQGTAVEGQPLCWHMLLFLVPAPLLLPLLVCQEQAVLLVLLLAHASSASADVSFEPGRWGAPGRLHKLLWQGSSQPVQQRSAKRFKQAQRRTCTVSAAFGQLPNQAFRTSLIFGESERKHGSRNVH